MFTIGIIDDRRELRETFSRGVQLEIAKSGEDDDIKVIDIPPFLNMEDFLPWIQENNIAVIILDENLHEAAVNGVTIPYNGHDLGQYLNTFYKNIPLFVVTSFKDSVELQDNLKEFFLIIPRDEFTERAKDLVNLFVNAGKNFYRDYHQKLENLTELSKKIALGQANSEEIDEAKTIQQTLQIPLSALFLNDRSVWLSDFQHKINDLENLNEEIQKFLNKHNL